MPWKRTDEVEQRLLFIKSVCQEKASFQSLCRAFSISRKTGYKWWDRFAEGGDRALRNQSRRPRSNSRAIDPDIARKIIELREDHPSWGPRTLIEQLKRRDEDFDAPAVSTVGELLRRRGVVRPRRNRPFKAAPRTAPLAHANKPNAVWSIDFKGWFRLGDRTRCDPFTATDNYSRFALCCDANDSVSTETVWNGLSRTFRDYGLPDAMRFDNGQPWSATFGDFHHTLLSVKLVRLGIRIERIAPGKPHENGRHERFHLTLAQETANPPARTLLGQARRFARFRKFFNDERPHQALNGKTPANLYRASVRKFPESIPEPEYGLDYQVHRVTIGGRVCFGGRVYFISTALEDQLIGLYETEEDCFEVWFCSELLGHIHRRHPEIGLVIGPRLSPMSPV